MRHLYDLVEYNKAHDPKTGRFAKSSGSSEAPYNPQTQGEAIDYLRSHQLPKEKRDKYQQFGYEQYTGAHYEEMDNALKHPKNVHRNIKTAVDGMISLIDATPKTDRPILASHAIVSGELRDKFYQNPHLAVGKTIKYKGFCSVALGQLGPFRSASFVVLEGVVPKGTRAAVGSITEFELVLAPGAKFKVTGYRREPHKVILEGEFKPA